jgi:toxin ParE1/3/4
MRSFRIHEEAAIEAEAAAEWYERQRPGLGNEFNEAIQAALDLLQESIVPLSPMPGKSGSRGVRRLVLHTFPYDVVVVERSGGYVVLAFAHHARRPGYWRDRERA